MSSGGSKEMNKKDINKLDYNDPNDKALLCSYLSTISYFDKDNQKKWLEKRFNMDFFDSYTVESLQYYIMYDDFNKNAYFVIRGTDIKRIKKEWRDLLISLRLWPKKVKETKGHNGYIRAGNKLLPLINEKVTEARAQGYNIIFTGHSMGGTLGKYIACTIDEVAEVYTFGAPSLVKSEFYDDVANVSVYKYRMDGDLVPMFPTMLYDDVFGDEFMIKRGSVVYDPADKKGFFAPLIFLTKIQLFYKLFTAVKTHNTTVYNLNLLRKNKNKNIKK